MFLDLEHPLLLSSTTTDPKFFIQSKPACLNDLAAFTSPEVASTASLVQRLKSRVKFSPTEIGYNSDVVMLESGTNFESPERLANNAEVEIIHDDDTETNRIKTSQTSDPDLVMNWTDDLEISFRFLADRRVNPSISYPMFPAPENLKKIPSVEYLNMRFRKRNKKKKKTYQKGSKSSRPTSTSTSTSTSMSKSAPKPKQKLSTPTKTTTFCNGIVLHKCNFCPKKFNAEEHLQRHIVLTHTKTKQFKCSICKLAFYQEDNLHRHMASHDTDSETSQDPRDEASPKNDENVVRNVIYSEDAPLKIRIPKKFVDFVASPIKKKEETTFGKKSFAVAVDDVGNEKEEEEEIEETTFFKVPEVLTPISNWKCSICSKIFSSPENLKQHEALHRINRAFRCGLCTQRFTQESEYRVHLAEIHNRIGYPCPHCNITFRTNYDVSLHVTAMHH